MGAPPPRPLEVGKEKGGEKRGAGLEMVPKETRGPRKKNRAFQNDPKNTANNKRIRLSK